jgi:hypothetical protein
MYEYYVCISTYIRTLVARSTKDAGNYGTCRRFIHSGPSDTTHTFNLVDRSFQSTAKRADPVSRIMTHLDVFRRVEKHLDAFRRTETLKVA